MGSGNQRSTATKQIINQEKAMFKDVRIFMVFFHCLCPISSLVWCSTFGRKCCYYQTQTIPNLAMGSLRDRFLLCLTWSSNGERLWKAVAAPDLKVRWGKFNIVWIFSWQKTWEALEGTEHKTCRWPAYMWILGARECGNRNKI